MQAESVDKLIKFSCFGDKVCVVVGSFLSITPPTYGSATVWASFKRPLNSPTLSAHGVMRIGAIAGYSKAMLKYKLNKQAEQLSTLINAGLRYTGTWNFTQDTMLVPYFIKLGEIPTEMTSNSNDVIYDVFGTAINAAYTIAQNGSHYTQFFIRLDTTKNNTYISSICHNIINTIKEFHDHANLKYVSTLGSSNDGGFFAYTYYGDAYCDGTNKCLKDMDIEQIDSFCRYASGKDNSHIKLVWTE